MTKKIIDKQQVNSILEQYDYFIFDCDGVIWLGDHILPLVVETIDLLKKRGKKVIFVTNNSSKSRNDYLQKFSKIGIQGITKDEVFGSSYASAVYINKILKLPTDKKVWVLGESGIEQELHDLGYETLGGTDPLLAEEGAGACDDHPLLKNLDDSVGAVVAGLTSKLNYLKLCITLQYLLKDNKSVPFVATNIDSTYPLHGKLLIGAGSIIQAVSYASGRTPDAICGKPNQSMMNTIKAENPDLQKSPSRGLMVGDRLNTDIQFGLQGGLDTLLVLTGIETENSVQSVEKTAAPTYYVDKLGDLYELLDQN